MTNLRMKTNQKSNPSYSWFEFDRLKKVFHRQRRARFTTLWKESDS